MRKQNGQGIWLSSLFWLRIIGVLFGAISLLGCSKKTAAASTQRENSRSPGVQREALVREAQSYLGTPYQYGGTSKKGIDCSGLACQVYREGAGLQLPRKADAQAQIGQAVPLAKAQPGDLVFFREPKSQKITHVGILVSKGEEGRFIHASYRGVREDSLHDPHWKARLVAVRKVLPEAKAPAHTGPQEKKAASKRAVAKKTSASAK